MAYYNYKRVVYREDYKQAKKELEARDGEEYENSIDYDGDAWVVVQFLLDKLNAEIEMMRDSLEKIADLDGNWGPFPENNEAWRAMAIVTARESVSEFRLTAEYIANETSKNKDPR